MGRLNEIIFLYYVSLSGLTAFYLTYTQALLPGLNYNGPSALSTIIHTHCDWLKSKLFSLIFFNKFINFSKMLFIS